MDIESEIMDLKRRVGDLEGAVNVLAGNIGTIRPDVVALREVSAARFDAVDAVMARMITRLDVVNSQVWSLRDDLPDLVSGAVRDAIRGPGDGP